MKKDIIATGVSGLVGSRIAQLLKNKYNFISFSLDKGIDITNFPLLEEKFKENKKASIVLHLAAFTDVSRAFNQTEDKNGSCYKINVVGSKNIAQLAKKYNKYLIFISTDFIFDGQNPPFGGYTEKDKPNPIEWYGKTKLWAEQKTAFYQPFSCILRITFPYKAKKANKTLEPKVKLDLVRKIIKKLKNKQKLKMFADQIITPTFIDDIAKVINKTINKKPIGIYHCVGSTSLSPYQLALKIADVFQLNKSLIKKLSLKEYLKQNPNSRPRQKNLAINNKKIQEELRVKMATIDEGLKECWKQINS